MTTAVVNCMHAVGSSDHRLQSLAQKCLSSLVLEMAAQPIVLETNNSACLAHRMISDLGVQN